MKKNAAFSLVELSIVLVILGLLTGGILAGQSLIRAAELRSVTTAVNNYTAAIQTFRDKYFGLPGDFNNATKFWTTCVDVADNTCNGNADGVIDGQATVGRKEVYRAWQHLALAGLVEGSYNGLHNGTGPGATAGTNMPVGKLARSSYFLGVTGGYNVTANSINLVYPNATSIWGYVIKPEEAWNIDQKMDDGLADGGWVHTFNGHDGTAYITGCVAAVSQWVSPATYILTGTANTCAMSFRILR